MHTCFVCGFDCLAAVHKEIRVVAEPGVTGVKAQYFNDLAGKRLVVCGVLNGNLFLVGRFKNFDA